MEIFDTHTHLNADDFAGREAEELALAKEMGVTRHNVVGFDAPTIKRAIELAEKYPEIYATIGWHPTEAGSYTQEIEDMIVANLSHPKVIGLGEIGLDYHWMEDPKDVQIEVFKRQIQLSKDLVMRLKILTLSSKKQALDLAAGLFIHFQALWKWQSVLSSLA